MPTADTFVLIYSKIKHFTDTPCWNIAARLLNEKNPIHIIIIFESCRFVSLYAIVSCNLIRIGSIGAYNAPHHFVYKRYVHEP